MKIDDKISLHVIESGEGEPVIFIHGATADAAVWERQIAAFAAEQFRAIAYSRRYNYPNKNEPQPNHSAVVEARDLERLLTELKIERAHVIGHSYGAYTALFLALIHPERIKTVTLAEPPLVPWLDSLPGKNAEAAKAQHKKMHADLIRPAQAAFASGDDEMALRKFLDYLSGSDALDRLPESVVARCRRNLPELKAIMTSDDPYPAVDREEIRKLEVPVLMLSGSKSRSTARFTDDEFERLLPKKTCRRVILEGATHIMWMEQPTKSRDAVLGFIREKR